MHDLAGLQVLDLAQSYGVQYQAYSSLRTFLSPETRGPEYDKARQQIQEVADRLHVTPAQVGGRRNDVSSTSEDRADGYGMGGLCRRCFGGRCSRASR